MTKNYHKFLADIFLEIGKQSRKVRDMKVNKTIFINHPNKKGFQIPYQPDVRYILRNNTEILIEIIDTQSKEKCIADIIRAYLYNAKIVCFVVKDKESEKSVYEIADVLLSKLADEMGTKKNMLPLDVKIVTVTEKELDNEEDLILRLKRELKL